MTPHRRLEVAATLICTSLVLPGVVPAFADQPPGQTAPASVASFDELKPRIRTGATIFVTDSTGREVSGKLSGLSGTSLELVVNETRQTFSQADVALVRQRQPDPLWNGLLIGAAAGATPAVYWLIADPNECGGALCMDDLAIGMIPCALAGLAIDAAIHAMVIVYRHPSQSPTTTFTLAPFVAGRGKGFELIVSF
jgi:hypothetical protein